ncbi:glycosyltransferase [Brachybacterium huguangmaarense]
MSVLRTLPGRAGDLAAFASAYADLTRGITPADLQPTVRRLLRRADRELARHSDEWALEAADLALQLSFHPSVHHGAAFSPLAVDPVGFLSPYRDSVVGRLLLETPDPVRQDRPGGSRVLVVSHGSWTFADRLVAELRAHTDLEITTLDLSSLPPAERPGHRAALAARWSRSQGGAPPRLPAALATALDGVDTVMVEWGTYALAWLTLADLPHVRVVARLHRFEAFTPYPMLMDFAQVDAMLFISPAVRDMVAETAPRLSQAHAVHLVANPHDYAPFRRETLPGAERTLIQIGWALGVKDVLFTFDVLDALRADDPRWRLVLVGTDLPESPIARERAYVRAVRSRLKELGGAVEVLGRRDDVPQVLRRAGFVMSSSRHEGSHESIAEGAASGCVPIVRDWPEARRWGGAAGIYPAEWVVPDVESAVARILAHVDPAVRKEAGRRAAAWVSAHRDDVDLLGPYEAAIRG